MTSDNEPPKWKYPVLFTSLNVGFVGVWIFTIANPWFPYTKESVPIYSFTFFGGWITSLIGMYACWGKLDDNDDNSCGWWVMCLASCVLVFLANCCGCVGLVG